MEALAQRLEDEHKFKIWLDRWTLIPGQSWQQGMQRGLDEADTCIVCLGANTPTGWFQQEIELALARQVGDQTFRVIPLLLPDASDAVTSGFLSLRTWADFRQGKDLEYAFHVLTQGIQGEPIGRRKTQSASSGNQPLAVSAACRAQCSWSMLF